MNETIFRFKVGQFACAIVNDGTFAYKEPDKVFFENAPRDLLAVALKAHGIDLNTWVEYVSPYPSLVVDTGQHLILIDTGMGNRVPTTGKLAANLQIAGYRPEDFAFVVLTHAHPDHVGGNLDSSGRPAYANAQYVMWRKEWEFWTENPDLSALRDKRFEAMMLDTARKYLPPIKDQLTLVEPEAEIVPGIKVIAASGHTPGQMAVVVSSQGEQLMAVSDVVFNPVQIEHPGWFAPLDLWPEETVATRRRLLASAAKQRMLVFAPHFVFPSLGHVEQGADGWRWAPVLETAETAEMAYA